jgi:hypothetical protein
MFKDHLSLFSLTKISHAFLIFSKLTECPDYLIIRNVITIIFYCENYKLFVPFVATFSDFYYPWTLFCNISTLCSFLSLFKKNCLLST